MTDKFETKLDAIVNERTEPFTREEYQERMNFVLNLIETTDSDDNDIWVEYVMKFGLENEDFKVVLSKVKDLLKTR